MIPEIKQPAVERALVEAFGVRKFEEIRLLTGGLSTALVFRIVVQGKPYLLRVIMRNDAMADPTRQIGTMKSAFAAGIAPRVVYASVEDRVLITDFVETRPFPENMATLLAQTIRKLHTLPDFPNVLNYFDTIDSFIGRFHEAKLLPESETEDLFRLYDEMAKTYPRNDTDLVATHNDLKPQNILFDGEQIWLVDWEAGFLNDRYVDLAVAANFFVADEAGEEPYLAAYFAEPPGKYRLARFFLLRQALSVFYMTFLMPLAAKSGAAVTLDWSAPDFKDYHRRLISGEIGMKTPDERMEYAKVHRNQALRNMQSKRFQDAIAIVAAHSATD